MPPWPVPQLGLGSAPARLPRLLRVRLAALAGSALAEEQPLTHWAPGRCGRVSSQPAASTAAHFTFAPPLSIQVQALARRLPLQVAALPVGGGVCVTLHFSFFQVRSALPLPLPLP